MLIFIFGSDSYSSKNQVLAMKERFLEKFDALGTNLSIFNVSNSGLEFGAVAQAVESPAFLAPKRMVIIKNLLSGLKKAEEKQWIELFDKIPESTIVIVLDEIDAQKARKMKIVSSSLASGSHVYEHSPLSVSEASKWLLQEAKQKSLDLNQAMAQDIVQVAGTDLWLLAGEISKLVAYCQGRAVTRSHIDLLVRSTADDQIFACLDACVNGDLKKMYLLFENQRDFGTPDAQLFALLVRQVRLLIATASLLHEHRNTTKQDISRELGIHPFVAQKLFSQVGRFELGGLINLQKKMLEMDFAVKTSKLTSKQSTDISAFCLASDRID